MLSSHKIIEEIYFRPILPIPLPIHVLSKSQNYQETLMASHLPLLFFSQEGGCQNLPLSLSLCVDLGELTWENC